MAALGTVVPSSANVRKGSLAAGLPVVESGHCGLSRKCKPTRQSLEIWWYS